MSNLESLSDIRPQTAYDALTAEVFTHTHEGYRDVNGFPQLFPCVVLNCDAGTDMAGYHDQKLA